jgi:hypothetical protein
MLVGYVLQQQIVMTIGLFALSGALTNWLAIHMLFEKVPGLYGSGVVPSRFEEFKAGIKHLMMQQFFTQENIDRFLTTSSASSIDLTPVIEKIDLAPSFDALVSTIEKSSFGGMLAMFGGTEALIPLKEPFIEKMKLSLVELAQSEEFNAILVNELEKPDVIADMQAKVANIVEQRLNENPFGLVSCVGWCVRRYYWCRSGIAAAIQLTPKTYYFHGVVCHMILSAI